VTKATSLRDTWGKNQQALAAEARGAAIKALQERHPDEWDELHREARAARGLSEQWGRSTLASLKEENERLRMELEVLRSET